MRTLKRSLLAVFVAGFAAALAASGAQQTPTPAGAPRPPSRAPANAQFVGAPACAECHADIVASHGASGMANALQYPKTSDILKANPKLAFKSGAFSYRLERRGDQTFYSVSDGSTTITEPVMFAFGLGKAGQTYVYTHDGQYFESRVSYYSDTGGLDLTIGHDPPVGDTTLVEAMGRHTSPDEIRACIGCHSTGAVSGRELKLDRLVPGVMCESCHGPGSEHIAAMKAGQLDDPKIANPGQHGGDEISQEHCGSCHRSAEKVLFMPDQAGINNVRFQPYRLFNAKCYSDDKRISCVACHDPHGSLHLDMAFYDQKCLACHAAKGEQAKLDGAEAKPPACPVGTKDCATCHMPKVSLPGSHFKFTDHRIRIAKAGEPFPT